MTTTDELALSQTSVFVERVSSDFDAKRALACRVRRVARACGRVYGDHSAASRRELTYDLAAREIADWALLTDRSDRNDWRVDFALAARSLFPDLA